jgi:choline kinase
MKEVYTHLKSLKVNVPVNIHIRTTPNSLHSFYELSSYLNDDCICLSTVDVVFREREFARFIHSFCNDVSVDGLIAVSTNINGDEPLYVKTDSLLRIHGFYDEVEDGCRYVSGGIYCFRRTGLSVLKKAINTKVAQMRDYKRLMVKEGLVIKAFPFSKIIDIDHADDIVTAESFLYVRR